MKIDHILNVEGTDTIWMHVLLERRMNLSGKERFNLSPPGQAAKNFLTVRFALPNFPSTLSYDRGDLQYNWDRRLIPHINNSSCVSHTNTKTQKNNAAVVCRYCIGL